MKGKFNSGIYAIWNKVDNKYYIGSSKNLRKRKTCHFKELRKGHHANRHLQSAVNRDGIENFIFIVLEIVNEKNLLIKEQKWIDTYGFKNLYNLCPKAESVSGRKLTREAIENQQKSFMENGGHPFKKPVAQINPLTLETIKIWDSIYQINKTLYFSLSDISECCNGNRIQCHGFYWEFATSKTYHQCKKNYKIITRNEASAFIGMPILTINTENNDVEYYENIAIAAREIGLNDSYIAKLLKSSKNTAKGFEFYYAFT